MKLSDTQAVLLTSASQRDSRSLYPLPETISSKAGAAKSIKAMLKSGLVEERETSAADEIARSDGDLRFGMFVTKAGLAAIGVEDEAARDEVPSPAPLAAAAANAAPRTTKSALVLELLGREGGATLAELVAATGWLPHTTRAALTGLRKKGHALEKTKRDGVTCYRVVGTAA